MKNVLICIAIIILIVLFIFILAAPDYYKHPVEENCSYIITTDESDNPFEYIDYDTIQIIKQKNEYSLYIKNDIDTFSLQTFKLRFLIKKEL